MMLVLTERWLACRLCPVGLFDQKHECVSPDGLLYFRFEGLGGRNQVDNLIVELSLIHRVREWVVL